MWHSESGSRDEGFSPHNEKDSRTADVSQTMYAFAGAPCVDFGGSLVLKK